jgi:DNA-binding GntR family transcriptional regulator
MVEKSSEKGVVMYDDEVNKDSSDKYTLRGKVFKQLRNDILSGKYLKDEELREVAIAEELGVSRTPVREAFRQLELEGLLQIIPNKGAYVQGITAKDVEDIYKIRSLLEGLCVKIATEKITPQKMEALEENILLSKFHAKKMHGEKLAELDNQFHEILYEASESRILEHLLKDFHQYVSKVREKNLTNNERGMASNEEHEEIMQAMKEQNAIKAEKLANQHIINAYKNMVDKEN